MNLISSGASLGMPFSHFGLSPTSASSNEGGLGAVSSSGKEPSYRGAAVDGPCGENGAT
jgi:hypothetical protein